MVRAPSAGVQAPECCDCPTSHRHKCCCPLALWAVMLPGASPPCAACVAGAPSQPGLSQGSRLGARAAAALGLSSACIPRRALALLLAPHLTHFPPAPPPACLPACLPNLRAPGHSGRDQARCERAASPPHQDAAHARGPAHSGARHGLPGEPRGREDGWGGWEAERRRSKQL